MKKRFLIFAATLISLIVFFTQCKKDEPITTGNISIVVNEYQSQESLDDALITVSGIKPIYHTDSDGEYTISDVEEGSYNITISKTNYVSVTKSINVKAGKTTDVYFTLKKEEPKLKVTPEKLDFGIDKEEMSVTISNENDKIYMEWKLIIPEDASWLSVSKESGKLSGEQEDIKVKVDRRKMSQAKTYDIDLKVKPMNGGEPVTVKIIASKIVPKLKVTPDKLDFGTDKQQMSLTVINENSKIDMEWEIVIPEEANWLSVSKESGILSGETEDIEIMVDRSKMYEEKTYYANLKVKSLNSEEYAIIQIIANKIIPKFRVEPQELNFGLDKNQMSFTITNESSNIDLKWEIIIPEYTNWLSVSNKKGNLGVNNKKPLEVFIDRSKFTETKTYTAQLEVKAINGDSKFVGISVKHVNSKPIGGVVSYQILESSSNYVKFKINFFIANGNNIISNVKEDNIIIADGKFGGDRYFNFTKESLHLKQLPYKGAYSADLVLDQSRSIGDTDPYNLRLDATKIFCSNLGASDYVLLTAFASDGYLPNEVTHYGNFTNDGTSYFNIIEDLKYKIYGGTPLYKATHAAILQTYNYGPTSNKAVIVFTDGEDNGKGYTINDLITLAQSKHVKIFTVGLSQGTNNAVLSNLAHYTGGAFLQAYNAPQLVSAFGTLGKILEGTAQTYSGVWTVNASKASFPGSFQTSIRIKHNGQTFLIPIHINVQITSKTATYNLHTNKTIIKSMD